MIDSSLRLPFLIISKSRRLRWIKSRRCRCCFDCERSVFYRTVSLVTCRKTLARHRFPKPMGFLSHHSLGWKLWEIYNRCLEKLLSFMPNFKRFVWWIWPVNDAVVSTSAESEENDIHKFKICPLTIRSHRLCWSHFDAQLKCVCKHTQTCITIRIYGILRYSLGPMKHWHMDIDWTWLLSLVPPLRCPKLGGR